MQQLPNPNPQNRQFLPPSPQSQQQPDYTQPQTYYAPQQPPIPPKKRERHTDKIMLAVIGAIVSIFILAIIIAIASTSAAPPVTDLNATATANADKLTATAIANNATASIGETAITSDLTQTAMTPTPVPTTPTPTFATFTDGTFQVGIDIQPGTYRTRIGSQGCYYARLKGFSGSLDDILANNNTDDPAIVTILPTDKGFESQNCGTWTKDLSQITTSMTTFPDGMYLVGVDIKPGSYKSSGNQGCYYARLSNFTGSLYSIIANNNTDNPAIVTISASDKGFQSTRCGTWTRI